MKVLLYQFHLKKPGLSIAVNKEYIGINYNNYWEFSSASCKRYAEKYGFDYLLINPTEEEWIPWFISEPQFDKFRAIELLKDYDAVIYVDTDIIIKPNSPNVVEEYRNDCANIVLNTGIGNKLLGEKKPIVAAYNTGVILWYKESYSIKDLTKLDAKKYGYEQGVFCLGDFIENRKDLKWWERWEDFKPFIGKHKSGICNDDKFIGFLISIFNLPVSHLHKKYNYIINLKKMNDIFSEEIYFIHYVESRKQFIKQHCNLFMEQ